MSLACVAERTFGFECSFDYTNKKLYKTFRALSGYYLFFAKKNVCKAKLILYLWHRNIIISILKIVALLGRSPLTIDRTMYESIFVSSELFKNCVWNLDPFRLQKQTPI
jgi:hypothetical protein